MDAAPVAHPHQLHQPQDRRELQPVLDGAEAWGIQFHPEVTPELWELWIARHPTEVREAGVDVEALRTAVDQGAERSLAVRSAIFDAFIDRVRSRWDA